MIQVAKNPVQEDLERWAKEKEVAVRELEALAEHGLRLERHTFFVPGWTGEEGQTWKGPYPKLPKHHEPIKVWFDRIVRNPERVTYVKYVTFSEGQSAACPSFLEFGELLKTIVREKAGPRDPVDLIGHSMGGLDIVAAITQGSDPVDRVCNCMLAGSPVRGVVYGRFIKQIDKLLPFIDWSGHHETQTMNMDHQADAIRRINTLASRKLLLERVGRYYQFEGTRDSVVMRNVRLDQAGLPERLKAKIVSVLIHGTGHAGPAGLTTDPRTILQIIKICCGLPLTLPKGNRGIVFRRS